MSAPGSLWNETAPPADTAARWPAAAGAAALSGQLADRLVAWQRAAAAVPMLLGVSVLCGWGLHLPWLTRGLPQWPQMLPNTALGAFACGLALLTLSFGPGYTLLSRGLASFGLATGLLALLEAATGHDFTLDHWLFNSVVNDSGMAHMSPAAALGFTLTGLVLLLHGRQAWRAATEWPLQAIGLVSLVRLISYPFGLEQFQVLAAVATLSVFSSIAFLALWIGLMCARGPAGALGIVLNPHQGGRIARWLLPVAVCVPLLNAWLRQEGERAGLFGHGEGAVLVVAMNGTLVAILVLMVARFLNVADARRLADETMLRRSEQRLRTMFESPLLGVSYWRLGGEILGSNQRFLELLGYAGPAASGLRHWDQLVPPGSTSEAMRRHRLQELEEHGRIAPFERTLLRADGSALPVLIGSVMLDGATGEGVAFILDITERRAAEERLGQRNLELERLNTELDSFSYSISHDLGAPLRAIDGFSKALEQDYAGQLDDAAQRYLARIRAGTQRMAQLIQDLLQLSQVSRAALTRERVDLSALAAGIAQQLGESAPDRSVEWRITPGLSATADRRLLLIVLENLLGNAFKFTAQQPAAWISVSQEQTPHGLALVVRDNGAGFDMGQAARLFTAFQRLHRAEDFAGTGIGLSIVSRIVARHGGTIWAEGAPGQGAAFCFTLDDGAEPPSLN